MCNHSRGQFTENLQNRENGSNSREKDEETLRDCEMIGGGKIL